jgi:hypothetical protein
VNTAAAAAGDVAGSVTPSTTHTRWPEQGKSRVTGTRRSANVKRKKRGAERQKYKQTKLAVVRKRSEREGRR